MRQDLLGDCLGCLQGGREREWQKGEEGDQETGAKRRIPNFFWIGICNLKGSCIVCEYS